MNTNSEDTWLYTISPKRKLIDLNFKEIWRYRDLLFLFVKRNIITVYKQTILGPLWYFIQPLFTSVIFTLIFNNLASIPTGMEYLHSCLIWRELHPGIILKNVCQEPVIHLNKIKVFLEKSIFQG